MLKYIIFKNYKRIQNHEIFFSCTLQKQNYSPNLFRFSLWKCNVWGADARPCVQRMRTLEVRGLKDVALLCYRNRNQKWNWRSRPQEMQCISFIPFIFFNSHDVFFSLSWTFSIVLSMGMQLQWAKDLSRNGIQSFSISSKPFSPLVMRAILLLFCFGGSLWGVRVKKGKT